MKPITGDIISIGRELYTVFVDGDSYFLSNENGVEYELVLAEDRKKVDSMMSPIWGHGVKLVDSAYAFTATVRRSR
jgi:hypothetical protein